MTDRLQSLTVVLDRDYRTDDVEAIVSAIRQIRGVSDVVPGTPVNSADFLARERVRLELQAKVLAVFRETPK